MNDFTVEKRDGMLVPFDKSRIYRAIWSAMVATATEEGGEPNPEEVGRLCADVTQRVVAQFATHDAQAPIHLEFIQDTVERMLMESGLHSVAKKYILYREEHGRIRGQTHKVSPEDMLAFQENISLFAADLELFQYLNKYSQFDQAKGRRETWRETVYRASRFMRWHLTQRLGVDLEEQQWHELQSAMLMREAMPSMRLLQMAGPAAQRCNVSIYNCSYCAITSLRDFTEMLYILMQGTGQSFSVEYDFVEELPKIKKQRKLDKMEPHVVDDSTEGWCDALLKGLETWFDGLDIDFDCSQIRPAGAPLKTKQGRASGMEPLRELLDFARQVILSRQGRRLRPIDAHDIACKIGKIVQVGGVRRAAEMSLSDLDDTDMRTAKFGEFWVKHPQRNMANNSVVYDEKPSAVEFMEEWLSLAHSGAGERGIFNRQGAIRTLPKRRIERIRQVFGGAWRRMLDALGINPCGEIKLLSKQFCNLSMAVIRPEDDWEAIRRKVVLATIFGTIQSTMTFFKYLGEEWRHNCEAERLLGVDIPGAADHPLLRCDAHGREERLAELRDLAIETNEQWSVRLSITPATALTCSKPGGNSSVFLGVGHTVTGWNARFMKRHVRVDAIDPMARFLIESGVPHWPEYDDPNPEAPRVWVFAFPLKAPDGAYINADVSATQMLENWLTVRRHWTEHNPSITVYVEPGEWLAVGHWVYEHWDEVGGLSFLPKDDHVYPLMPITPLTEEEYNRFVADFPRIPWEKFPRYDTGDYRPNITRDFACFGDSCALV